mgnify:CR=1 FL=1
MYRSISGCASDSCLGVLDTLVTYDCYASGLPMNHFRAPCWWNRRVPGLAAHMQTHITTWDMVQFFCLCNKEKSMEQNLKKPFVGPRATIISCRKQHGEVTQQIQELIKQDGSYHMFKQLQPTHGVLETGKVSLNMLKYKWWVVNAIELRKLAQLLSERTQRSRPPLGSQTIL